MTSTPGLYRPPSNPIKPQERRRLRRLALWGVFVLFFGFGLAADLVLYWIWELPSISQLENIEPNQATRIYSADDVLLKEFFIERRFAVSLDRMPKHLIAAVLAAEDREFYQHWGLNVRRIFLALIKDITSFELAQGASTITQQLSRNLFLTLEKSVARKIKEAIVAVEIEKRYTKEEILEFYLNQIYMGGGTYGMQAASRRYFRKDISKLTLSECALLAATIRTPERYRPDEEANRNRVRKRRDWVLKSMRDMDAVSKQEYARAVREPIRVNTLSRATANYAPYFSETVRKYLEKQYGTQALYTGGLTVTTTLRYRSQYAAELAMVRKLREVQVPINREFVSRYKLDKKLRIPSDTLALKLDSLVAANPSFLEGLVPDSAKDLRVIQCALVGLDTKTGAILAMVGGRDFEESEFNRATHGLRQPGSAFKPFVYAAAIGKGYTPASVIVDQPLSLETNTGTWRPDNYDKVFLGRVTLRKALERSINLASIQLIKEIGPGAAVSTAQKMGIYHPLSAVLALAVGACDVTPIEITSAYSVFGNGGVRAKPYYIQKVVDKDGTVLEEAVQEQSDALDPRTAYITLDMMRGVILRGTGYGARVPGGFLRPAAGKTGTTNDYTDAWFLGFTPQVTCGVWVGVDNKRSMGSQQTGAGAAVPIWAAYMNEAHKGLPEVDFERPEGIEAHAVCAESWLLARRTCPKVVSELFAEDSQPLDTCNISHFEKSKKREKQQLLF